MRNFISVPFLVFGMLFLNGIKQLNGSECKCRRIFRPVCGTDGKTYNNECRLNCTKEREINGDLRLAYNGVCCPKPYCHPIQQPLCDDHGWTYENECTFRYTFCIMRKMEGMLLRMVKGDACLNRTKNSDDCTKPSDCPQDRQPVCDTGGRTHKNFCYFDSENCLAHKLKSPQLLIAFRGECNTGDLEKAKVRQEGQQMAIGVVERTRRRDNLTSLDAAPVALPRLQPTLRLRTAGIFLSIEPQNGTNSSHEATTTKENSVCDESSLCNDDSGVVSAVCDNENRTHDSLCELRRRNCRRRSEGRQDQLVLVHLGLCGPRSPTFSVAQEACPEFCTLEFAPVCDDRGVSHSNLCNYQIASCRERKRNGWGLELAKLADCAGGGRAQSTTEATTTTKATTAAPQKIHCPPPRCENAVEPICDNTGSTHSICATACNDYVFFYKICYRSKFSCLPAFSINMRTNSFRNLCLFTWARCLAAQNGVPLTIQSLGRCSSTPQQRVTKLIPKELRDTVATTNGALADRDCDVTCSEDMEKDGPLCADDLSTYTDSCHLEKANCLAEKLDEGRPPFELLFRGNCSECLNHECVRKAKSADEMVCDKEGRTRNRCEFLLASCIFERRFGRPLEFAYAGECCRLVEDCPTDYEPICDVFNNTHPNRCIFEARRCFAFRTRAFQVQFAHDGPCRPAEGGGGEVTTTETTSTSTSRRPHVCGTTCEDGDYDPICAVTADGWKTFPNLCHLEAAKCHGTAEFRYQGSCCDTRCPKHWAPVCDTEGRTHRNLCEFESQRCMLRRLKGDFIEMVQFEVCEKAECTKQCDKAYKPVCGNDGATYPNQCLLDEAACYMGKVGSLRLAYNHSCCKEPTSCSAVYQPLCDSRGRTHMNRCFFETSVCLDHRLKVDVNVSILHEGPCCGSRACTSERQSPVCDNEGNSHANICLFRLAQCEAEVAGGGELRVKHAGNCCAMPTSCRDATVLCDSDGQTHHGKCSFYEKRCRFHADVGTTDSSHLTVAYIGECCTDVCRPTGNDTAVCDTEGVTHESLCAFERAKCRRERMFGNGTLALDYTGVCCQSECPENFDPVCDHNGQMYSNRCNFDKEACTRDKRGLQLLLLSPCAPQAALLANRRYFRQRKLRI